MNIEVITKSRLAVFNSCQRLHHVTYNLGYRSLQPRELADWGTLFHAGLDAWWGAYKNGSAPYALPEAAKAMETARAGLDIDDAQMAKAQIMMIAYDLRWAPTMDEYEVLGVEVEFVAVIPGRRGLRVAGKLDKLVRQRSDGTVWFVEHKTTGADLTAGSSYWQKLRMDPQVSIYHGGCKVLGYEPAGCLYDVIDRPSLRPLKATPEDKRKYTKAGTLYANQRDSDETVEEFRDRLAEMVSANPDAYFARMPIIRLDSEIAESARDVEETALQIRATATTDHAPRNPGNCFLYGRTCEFHEACSGVASLDDPALFRRAESTHEELSLSQKL